MRKSNIPTIISHGLFDTLVEIRVFGWGRVVAGEEEGHYVLIVQEKGNTTHTLYEYDDPAEFHADVRRVVRFGEGGDPNSGVTAPISPFPPSRSAGFEEPVPEENPQ